MRLLTRASPSATARLSARGGALAPGYIRRRRRATTMAMAMSVRPLNRGLVPVLEQPPLDPDAGGASAGGGAPASSSPAPASGAEPGGG
jgi:hypothetical protein